MQYNLLILKEAVCRIYWYVAMTLQMATIQHGGVSKDEVPLIYKLYLSVSSQVTGKSFFAQIKSFAVYPTLSNIVLLSQTKKMCNRMT